MILTFSPSCVLHQLPRITGRVPVIDNQIVYIINNIAVCSYNWNTFYPWRIECFVKSIWR